MAIQFVTGLPRAGKTLWTIDHVRSLAQKDNRQVYTCNIPEVTIDGWLTIDHPDKWMEVPNGSIIVVDELQDFWGLNPTGSKVPEPILELSKHGKRGIDFFFITQEPELVHRTPRALCQHHWFVVRAFGTHNAAVYKFERMQQHPDKVKSKGEKFPWRYPSEAFGRVDKATGVVIVKPWYKSADTHNVKRQIPAKLWAIPGGLLLAGLGIWGAVHMMGATIDKAKMAGKKPGQDAQTAAGAPGATGQPGAPQQRAPMTPAEYLNQYAPRVEGLQHSAPAYDQLTVAKQVPVPAACIYSKTQGCHCYTQQATPYRTTQEICLQVVKGGMFIPWEEPKQQQAQAQAVAPAPVHAAGEQYPRSQVYVAPVTAAPIYAPFGGTPVVPATMPASGSTPSAAPINMGRPAYVSQAESAETLAWMRTNAQRMGSGN